jgi:hypothetical protein
VLSDGVVTGEPTPTQLLVAVNTLLTGFSLQRRMVWADRGAQETNAPTNRVIARILDIDPFSVRIAFRSKA